tara:strand:+ start:120 stop:461 length:342 start_codon:yes stop_codon:yes gene_type:complete
MIKLTQKRIEQFTKTSIVLGLIPLAMQLIVSIIFIFSRNSIPILRVLARFTQLAPYILGVLTLIGLVLGIIALKKSTKEKRSLPLIAILLNGLILVNYLINIIYIYNVTGGFI